jgi:DNA-binding CsgD family transcriptional regulator
LLLQLVLRHGVRLVVAVSEGERAPDAIAALSLPFDLHPTRVRSDSDGLFTHAPRGGPKLRARLTRRAKRAPARSVECRSPVRFARSAIRPPATGLTRRGTMPRVTDASHRAASDPLVAAWWELQRGRWDAARVLFRSALDVHETPEALEGLSWAAWWLDDEQEVFGARERAYGLYRSRGDAPGAARMAIWLAVDQLDFRGAWTVASGWLRRAHRLLDGLEPGAEHGWLAFHEGYLANADGDTDTARELAARAAELGRRFGITDLEMLGLALEGATLVGCARVDEGMRCLDEATAAALEGDAEIPISAAWTFCILVNACTAALDFERASEWCDRIAEFAERYGSRYMLAFCRAEYGAVHLWRGRWDDAEAMLEASVEDFSRSRPAWVAGPLVALAELRRRQARPADAARLLDRAGASVKSHLCRARLALDRGATLQAVELLERLLRQLPADRGLDRAPALELLVHARAARGELEEAATAAAALRAVETQVGTAPLRAGADLAEGVLACANGDHERGRALLEDALDRFERSGAPFETARARLELAACLIALGRDEAAEREAARALACLSELGAELDAGRARRILASTGGGLPLAQLTPREREVLGLLADGLTNRQIAARLVVSEHTVHRHVTNLLRKLDLPSRTAAAAHAVRSGLFDRSPS